jgi:cobalt/nickel transport system permease protein
MEHAFLDEYSKIDSFLGRLDPRIKVLSFLALIICIVFTKPTAFKDFAFYGILLSILIGISKIPLQYLLKRFLMVTPFIMMTVLFIPFLKGEEVMRVILWESCTLIITREGLVMLWNIVIKSYFSLIAMTLLTASTAFPKLLKALESLRFPHLFIMILSFMYRYIFVIQDEFMKMKQAKESRSVGGSRRLQLKALTNMIGVLFIRSYERAESVYLAMCSRAFNGRIRTLHEFRLTHRDMIFLFTMILSLVGIQWMDMDSG